jgi:hypothetical protein
VADPPTVADEPPPVLEQPPVREQPRPEVHEAAPVVDEPLVIDEPPPAEPPPVPAPRKAREPDRAAPARARERIARKAAERMRRAKTRAEGAPPEGGAPPDGAPPEGEGPKTPGRKAPAFNLNWRSVAAVLVALAVAFWIGRGLFGPTGPETPSTTAGDKSVQVPKAKKPANRAVVIDGSKIQAAGAVITLNPALAQPGTQMNISGSGFDPGSFVDVVLSVKGESTGSPLGSFKTDTSGGLSAAVTVPDNVQGSKVIVTAQQRNSDNVATAEAVTASGMGYAKLSKATGKPGDSVSVSARGFLPGEKIKVYWGRASGVPTATLQADQAGTVSKAPIKVGVGQVGNATMVLVGAKSGTTATVPFYMLGLYPEASTEPYALKAADTLNLSASGFAPDERVMVYVNTSSGQPVLTAKADSQGSIGELGFKVPFGLKGSQSVVMVGEQSRASVSSGFQVLPYTPSAQPSTYGGSPGTSFSFFAKGFAPKEVVLVYLGRTKWNAGELVSAFRVNDQGDAGAAGSYEIGAGDQGTLSFTLVGRESGGQAGTTVRVAPANGPVDLPEKKPYKLPQSLRR